MASAGDRRELQLLDAERLAGVGSWSLDLPGGALRWSPQLYRLYGLDPSAAPDRQAALGLIHPDDRATVGDPFEGPRRTPGEFSYEYRLLRDGEERLLSVQGELRADEHGSPVSVLGTVQDVTEREREQSALERSRALHAAILESALDCVVTMDARGQVLDFNPAAQRTFGYRREEAIGRELAELIVPPELRSAHREALARQVEHGGGSVLGRRIELNAMRADGTEFPVELAITRTDIGGEMIFTGYLRDLTEARRADSALRAAEQRYRSLVERIPTVTYICDYDEAATVRYISPQVEALTGYPPERWLDDPHHWKRIIHPDDAQSVKERIVACVRAQVPFEAEYRLVRADGGVLCIWEQETLVRDDDGAVAYCQGVIVDITPIRAAAAALRQSEALHRSTIEALTEGVVVLDGEGRAIACNSSGTQITGLDLDAVIDLEPPFQPSFLADGTPLNADNDPALGALRSGETARDVVMRIERPDGAERWLSANYQPLDSGDGAGGGGLVWSFTDITERRRDEAQIAYLAYHDALTGLPNRRKFEDHLGPALARARRHGEPAALLYFDLDHFKVVNDSLGHPAGDELLRQIARRLSARVRAGDLLARHGGDEFMLLLSDLGADPRAAVERVARDMLAQLRAPFVIDGAEFEIAASAGISFYPSDGESSQELLARADAALYQTKRAGRASFSFYRQASEDPSGRLTFSARLRRALEQDEFELHYQPLIELGSGDVVCLEALVRWRDPTEGLLSPAAFIPLAEETGLIELIDHHVFDRALAQLATWTRDGLQPQIAINVSPRMLSSDDLPARLVRALERHDVDPSRVTIEITESAATSPHDRFNLQLRRLKEIGLNLALDDFGADFSSLSRLRELPVDTLKIDRQFLRGVPDDTQAAAMVSAVLRLADALGLQAVAEGVETEAQRQFLLREGCRFAQGYHLGRPAPAAAVQALLRVHEGDGVTHLHRHVRRGGAATGSA
jgi:diguanylate cyclase (GGDEF)-like protein/PAS domain S-box-containing protein